MIRPDVVNVLARLLREDDARGARVGRQKGRRPVSWWGLPWVRHHCGKRAKTWPNDAELLAAAAQLAPDAEAFVARVREWLAAEAAEEAGIRRRLAAGDEAARALHDQMLSLLWLTEQGDPPRERWRREELALEAKRLRAHLGDPSPELVRVSMRVREVARGWRLHELYGPTEDGGYLIEIAWVRADGSVEVRGGRLDARGFHEQRLRAPALDKRFAPSSAAPDPRDLAAELEHEAESEGTLAATSRSS